MRGIGHTRRDVVGPKRKDQKTEKFSSENGWQMTETLYNGMPRGDGLPLTRTSHSQDQI